MRRLLLSLGLVALLACAPVLAQDGDGTPAPNPLTMGKGPKDGDMVPSWIFYWLLGIGSVVSGSLVFALRTLWHKLDEERKAKDAPGLTEEERTWLKETREIVVAKNEDGVPRAYTPRTLQGTIDKLTELSQDMVDKLGKLGDSREDRQSMRSAFDTEKAQMRQLYTAEIKSLQTQLHQEQKERREETQQLWQKNDSTTREVMTVIRDMIVALENATRLIETYHEAEE